MNSDITPSYLRLASWLKRLACCLGVVVATGGIAVLFGWDFRIETLKRIIPGMSPMNPVAGVGFVVAGVALCCYRAGPGGNLARKVGRLLAVAALLLGAVRLAEHGFGWKLNFDQFLFRSQLPSSALIQMAPATAFEFLISGLALCFLHSGRTRSYLPVQILALVVTLISMLPLVGYLYNTIELYTISRYVMALPTTLLFCVLGGGLFISNPDQGMAALFTRKTPGGTVSRRLLPLGLILPVALGALSHWAVGRKFVSAESSLSILVVVIVAIFSLLIWLNAVLLDRADKQRSDAEQSLRKAHDELESRVRERTAELSSLNQELAGQITERKMAEEHVKSQLARLELLQHITRAIGERLDLPSIFQVVVRDLEEQMPLDFCCVCRRDEDATMLTVATSGLRGREFVPALGMDKDERLNIVESGLTPCVSGRLIYEPDATRSQSAFSQRLARAGLRSMVIAPLAVESHIFGFLMACRRQAEAFSSIECEFLRQLSEHVALASHQAQLHSALQEAYEDLRKTQEIVLQQERLRALGQMASGIAHDINNAIAPVSLYTESLLEREQNLSPWARQSLGVIQRSIEDVAQTVSRMREFYRKREPELGVGPIALNALVRQVLELSRARWSDQPQQQGQFIENVVELAEDLPAVSGVESEIREALLNLVFNAVDAMPQGGKLTLRTRSANSAGTGSEGRGPRAVVEVSDTGVGMDEETRRRCLEPFFTTKGERGTGLGLAMVYGIVERHRAEIEIESELNRGTTVRMMFPPATTEPASPASPAGPVAPRGRLRILVVDDDPMLLKSLRNILESDGHFVVSANGGQEGIASFRKAMAEQKAFSLVITDLGMPQVDGRKVAQAIKEASASTPIILLTGWGQRLIEDGEVPPYVDRVLSKPPKISDLRRALAQCEAGNI